MGSYQSKLLMGTSLAPARVIHHCPWCLSWQIDYDAEAMATDRHGLFEALEDAIYDHLLTCPARSN